MSDSSEKSRLVTKVVEMLFGDMLSRPFKVREDVPEDIKAKMLETGNTITENHRRFSEELYAKHMTVEQLQALWHFHTSDIGKSIKEAEKKIQKELRGKYKELASQNEMSKQLGAVSVRTKTHGLEDDEDS